MATILKLTVPKFPTNVAALGRKVFVLGTRAGTVWAFWTAAFPGAAGALNCAKARGTVLRTRTAAPGLPYLTVFLALSDRAAIPLR
jgi:hypothetical protein